MFPNEFILVVLANNLKRIRQQAGLTQSELAVKTGIHKNYISGVERGQRNISLCSLSRIARGLNTSPDRLLSLRPV